MGITKWLSRDGKDDFNKRIVSSEFRLFIKRRL